MSGALKALGRVAQSVEQGIENPRVGGSIPSPATPSVRMALVFSTFVVWGCGGDRCATLCRDVSSRLDECRSAALSWEDLGASGRADFSDQCRDDWDRERTELSTSHLSLSLTACADASDEVIDLSCEEITALYGPID
jgi:hypothetical protein